MICLKLQQHVKAACFQFPHPPITTIGSFASTCKSVATSFCMIFPSAGMYPEITSRHPEHLRLPIQRPLPKALSVSAGRSIPPSSSFANSRQKSTSGGVITTDPSIRKPLISSSAVVVRFCKMAACSFRIATSARILSFACRSASSARRSGTACLRASCSSSRPPWTR
jgi:hypothetical protein